MEQVSQNKVEVVNLSPEEKIMYEKYLEKHPDMTVMGWKEIRNNALKVKYPDAKGFYIVNEFLVEGLPDVDQRRELSGKN